MRYHVAGSDEDNDVPGEEGDDNFQSSHTLESVIDLAQELPDSVKKVDRISLEQDMWSFAWVTCLQANSQLGGCCSFLIGLGVALLTLAVQIVAAVAIFSYLTKEQGGKEKALASLAGDIVQNFGSAGFKQLEPSDAEAFCGKYGDDYDFTTGPGTFRYKKVPVNTWTASDLVEADRSELEKALFPMQNLSLYEIVLLVVLFLFFCRMLQELSSIKDFFLIVFIECFALDDNHDNDSEHLSYISFDSNKPLLRSPTGTFQLNAIGFVPRLLGLLIVAIRFAVFVFVSVVGADLLSRSNNMVDLVLNSLGLVFIVELDELMYRSILSKRLRLLLQSVEPVTKKMPSSLWSLVLTGLTFIVSSILALVTRHFQIRMRTYRFVQVATMCLFLGPNPNNKFSFDAVFPVPGFCENLLNLECSLPQRAFEDQCLFDKKRLGSGPCAFYDVNASSGCNKSNVHTSSKPFFFGDSPIDVLKMACDSMLQEDPRMVEQVREHAWIDETRSKLSVSHVTFVKGLDKRSNLGFPRMRDVSPSENKFAGPFACSRNVVMNFLERAISETSNITTDLNKIALELHTLLTACKGEIIRRPLDGDGAPCQHHTDCAGGFCSEVGVCKPEDCFGCARKCNGIASTCSQKCDRELRCANRFPVSSVGGWDSVLDPATGLWMYTDGQQSIFSHFELLPSPRWNVPFAIRRISDSGNCPNGSWHYPGRSQLGSLTLYSPAPTNWQCCEDCPGGTRKCYADCSCQCLRASSCESIWKRQNCMSHIGCRYSEHLKQCVTIGCRFPAVSNISQSWVRVTTHGDFFNICLHRNPRFCIGFQADVSEICQRVQKKRWVLGLFLGNSVARSIAFRMTNEGVLQSETCPNLCVAGFTGYPKWWRWESAAWHDFYDEGKKGSTTLNLVECHMGAQAANTARRFTPWWEFKEPFFVIKGTQYALTAWMDDKIADLAPHSHAFFTSVERVVISVRFWPGPASLSNHAPSTSLNPTVPGR